MTYAVSDIAWPVEDDTEAHEMLAEEGIRLLEIEPSRFWPDLLQVSEAEARARTESIAKQALLVGSVQALLSAKPELQVFGENGGKACQDYLKAVCRIAGWMGAGVVIFGSPANRLRGTLSRPEAVKRAVEFFHAIGDAALENNTVLCLKPSPAAYGADFLLTTQEAAQVIYAVDSPGVRLNLDVGELIMNESDVYRTVTDYLPLAGNLHASEPMLAPFNAKTEAHRQAAAALKASDYEVLISLEMKPPANGLPAVHQALLEMRRVYG